MCKLQPWECAGVPWKSEKEYLNWLRSAIRRVWSRHPVKVAYKQQRRYKAPIGRGGRLIWVSDCEMCGQQHKACEVDHLEGGYGFKDWQSFTEWAKMILWVTFDEIRELCPSCHGAVTLSQKLKISLEDAFVEKETIEIMKSKKDKTFLKDHGILPASNAEKRREQVRQVLKEELTIDNA